MLRRTGAIGALIALLTVLFLTPSAFTADRPARPAKAADDGCRVLAPGATAAAERAVDTACAQVAAGVWYTWGGGHGAQPGPTYGKVDPTDPASEHDPERLGFDCSGLVRYAYAQATGADILDGDASAQYYTHRTAARFTAAEGLAPLRPGDLLAYGASADLHHIALYLGAGKMVEARQSGTKLMVSDVRLGGSYFGAVRVNTGAVEGPVFRTWGTGVWTKAQPSVPGRPRLRLPRTHHRPRRLPEARRERHRRGLHQRRLVLPPRLPRLGHQHLHPGPGLAGRRTGLHHLSRAGVRNA
ncbi:putative NLP/P60-family secreted protein (PgpA peptidase) [Streptomyces sp. EAS-AB2608]|uniref:C40 family peptidase n=1 Tax=Streptomyces sp. EAS-AB2608 TaxID=2779671 RepID=UPI001BEEDD5C|nr:NlpC/P60 family protein [Streptomyces sp. EAS-AB2608]BCM72779.1 putative NLP/P60-family secreted protein (PgpA peptidase) [Streptomyces sp. EAS-AB2608]